MPTLSAGSTVSLSLDNDDVLTTSGNGRFQVTPTTGSKSEGALTGTQNLGPFQQYVTVSLTALTDIVYSTSTNSGVAPAAKFALDSSGNVTGLVGSDGLTSYSLTVQALPVVFPDEIYSVSTSGGVGVMAGPCYLVGVRGQTVTAGPLTVTIYDNIASATGTVLYTGSINTGTEATIATPVLAYNGVFLSFTGTGTFDVTLRGAL